MTAPRRASDDEVPVTVRLGTVVPPEDAEDWTRPLTWVAAFGMLAAPISALAWFVIAPPTAAAPSGATRLLAAVLAVGASLVGATQIGAARAFAGTVGAALFGALGSVLLGLALSGERQVVAASPTLAHAFVGAVGGLAGALPAAALAAGLAGQPSRLIRWAPAAALGAAASAAAVALVGGG